MDIMLVQPDTVWKSPGINLERLEKMIDKSSCDLIVFPEMFTTGFITSPEGVAEKEGGATLEWMRAVGRKHGAAVAGSVSVESEGKYYNRFFFVKPDGNYETYDKRHLFSFAGEDKEYTAGKERVTVEWCGFRILFQICYDLRFPVFSRNRNDCDMILYIGNWPGERIEAWNTLLRARAIENRCYVAGVNRVGSDPGHNYNGGTVLIDWNGSAVASVEEGVEGTVCAEANIDALRKARTEFPVLADADDFELNI